MVAADCLLVGEIVLRARLARVLARGRECEAHGLLVAVTTRAAAAAACAGRDPRLRRLRSRGGLRRQVCWQRAPSKELIHGGDGLGCQATRAEGLTQAAEGGTSNGRRADEETLEIADGMVAQHLIDEISAASSIEGRAQAN